MKKILLLILLLAPILTAHAQQYFNKRYPLYSHAAALTAIIPRDGKYYCSGTTWDSSNSVTGAQVLGLKFTILDSDGSILKDTVYQLPGTRNFYTFYNNAFYSMPDKGFLLCLSQDFAPATTIIYGMIVRYDSVGNIIWTREYNKPFCTDSNNSYSVADLKPTGTGEWLMLSTIQCHIPTQLPTHIVLTKLDSSFNPIWEKKYDYPLPRSWGRKLFIDASGYHVLNAYTNSCYIGMSGNTWQAQLIKTDTAGHVQWDWLSNIAKENSPYSFIRTMDGGYLYCGMGNGHEISVGGGGEVISKGWIEKIDSNGNVLWNDTLGNIYSTALPIPLIKIIELPDSTIVTGGVLGGGFDEDSINNSLTYACMVKYKPNGSEIWKRKYTFINDSLTANIYDIKGTSDNGFVMCGDSYDFFGLYGRPRQQGWVIKVDGNGCMSLTDPQCSTLQVVMADEPEISVNVYPNPAKNVLHIATSQLMRVGQIAIFDIYGRTVLKKKLADTQETVDITRLDNGLYIYRITDGRVLIKAGKVEKW